MKSVLFVSCMLVAGVVFADDLSDANKLLNAKEYGKALPLYTKLAQGGNAEAQFRLGEMYWFGDGTAADLGKAAIWFQKSAAAGNADAAESLAALKRREVRGNEIVYWMKDYKGDDLVGGKYACQAPAIPAVSKKNDEIKKVNADVVAWEQCYNNAVANMQSYTPVLKHVPKDVLDMMTPSEIEQTQAHLEKVLMTTAASMRANAGTVLAQRDAWTNATNDYVRQANAAAQSEMHTIETHMRRLNEANQASANAPRGPNPPNH